MYRQHESPIISGYLRYFVPPNKINISRYPDNPVTTESLQQFASVGAHYYTQTITMLGISSEASGPDVDRFMWALINVKECNTLVPLTEEYKYVPSSASFWLKEVIERYFSRQIKVIIAYPTDHYQNLYFDETEELAGVVLLDRSEDVCLQLHDQKLTFPESHVRLGSLMTTGAKDEKRYAEPGWLDSSTRSEFINLNQYLTSNGYLKRSNFDKSDPQIQQGDSDFYMRWFDEDPVKEGIKKVLTVGGASGSTR